LIHDANVTYKLLFSKFISAMGWEWVMHSNFTPCAPISKSAVEASIISGFFLDTFPIAAGVEIKSYSFKRFLLP